MKRYIFSFIIALLTSASVSAQLPVADLVDIVFQKDGTAIDKCGHNVRKRGGCTAVWNATYNRYCGVATVANTDYYSIKCFNSTVSADDITPKLKAKTFTMETLVKVTGSFDDNTEKKVFSGTQGGGIGLFTCKIANSPTKDQHPWTFLVGTNNGGANTWQWTTDKNTPSTGVFYHLVGVYSTSGAKLYVNGVKVAETSFTADFFPMTNTYNSFHLFGDPKSDEYKVSGWNTLYQCEQGIAGEMAIARMYGKSLTDAEVKALYNNLTSGSTEEPSEPSTPTTSTDNVTADLFDVVFRADGTATNISTNDVTVTTVKEPKTEWNAVRGRYTTTAEPTVADDLRNTNNTNYHKIDYTNNDDINYAILTGRKYTLEALIKFNQEVPVDDSSDKDQVKFVSSTQGGGVCLDTDGGTFRFMVNDGSSTDNGWKNVDSNINPEVGEFYHVVGVRNGTTISIYVNGNLINSATVADGAKASEKLWFNICGDPHTNGGCSNAWPCELAIARMYSTALTDAQVKDSYNAIRKFDLSVPQPDMFDIAFGNDNIAKDVKSTGTPMNVTYKDKVQFYSSDGTAQAETVKNVSSNKWSTIFNREYGRFALHSNYNWGTGEVKDRNKPNFEFSYKDNSDFKRKMTNGHTIELLANVLVNPSTVVPQVDGESGKSYQEAKWLSTCERGGVAMMVGYDDSNNANVNQEHEYMHYIIYTDGREHHIGSDKWSNLQVSDTESPTGITNACAEIDNETNSLTQTVKGLTKGWYRLSCDGFYTGSGTNSAKLFAKSGNRDEVTKDFKELSSTDASTLETYKSSQLSAQGGDFNKEYLLNDNTAAAKILNPATRATASDYKNWLYVYVGEGENLNIGFRKESEEGQAFADNFTLQYSGVEKAPIEIYQSASKSKQGDFDKKVHVTDVTDEMTEVTYNLRRIFYKDQWNALVLPVSLTGAQLKAAFGNGVKLSRLYGVNENRPTQLVFKLVNWTDDDDIVLKAHDCYVIKPSELNYLVDNDKSIKGNDDEYKFYSKQINEENPSLVSAWGPLFQFRGVSQKNEMPDENTTWDHSSSTYSYTIASGGYPASCTWDRTTGNNQYKMRVTCYYERPQSVPAQRYIVENGKVYYLSSEYNNLYATYWSLEDVTGTTTKAFSMAFDDDETTVIHGLEAEAKAEDNRMYNLNGQRIANDAKDGYLPKGIYITNGRKVVVR